MKQTLPIITAVLSLCAVSCTTLYGPDGKKRLTVGDTRDFAYQRGADGSESLTASSTSISTPITAVGKIITPIALAAGTVAGINATTQTVKAVRAPLLPR